MMDVLLSVLSLCGAMLAITFALGLSVIAILIVVYTVRAVIKQNK